MSEKQDKHDAAFDALVDAMNAIPGVIETEFMDFHDASNEDGMVTAFFYVWADIPIYDSDE